jgi:SAM-dependent methyltransferase
MAKTISPGRIMTESRQQEIFFEIHDGLPREGPGSNPATRRVLEMLPRRPRAPLILDVGCGPGMQTLELAKRSGGRIVAVDNHLPFLRELARRAAAAGLSCRIHPVRGTMAAMGFTEGAFDLVWSEGAVYILGFEAGLRQWRRYLKKSGFLVVSEITWLKSDVPEDLRRFWDAAYPAMETANENLRVIAECGYRCVGLYVLPEDAWWHDYYRPLERRLRGLLRKYKGDPEAVALLRSEREEINLFRKHSDCYGYVFYAMQPE